MPRWSRSAIALPPRFGTSGGFEPLHLALASSHHSVRVLGPIVFAKSLLVVAAEPEAVEGSAVGAQLIGDHHLRREGLLSQQLAHKLDGRALVPSALNHYVEDLAFVVNRAPQVHRLARNPDNHFVEMPYVDLG
jgi:hypothetical protein